MKGDFEKKLAKLFNRRAHNIVDIKNKEGFDQLRDRFIMKLMNLVAKP